MTDKFLLFLTSMATSVQKIVGGWIDWQTRKTELENLRQERKYFYQTLNFAIKAFLCLLVLLIIAFFSVTLYLVYEVSKKQDIHHHYSSTTGDKKGIHPPLVNEN